jgi:hypothetical protein
LKAVTVSDDGSGFLNPFRIFADLLRLPEIYVCSDREKKQDKKEAEEDEIRDFHRRT